MLEPRVVLFPPSKRLITDFFEGILKLIPDKQELEGDVVLLLVDEYAVDYFEERYYSFYDKKVVAYVLELSYKTIPLLKVADYIIYQDRCQRDAAELVLGYAVPSSIIPLTDKDEHKAIIDNHIENLVVYSAFPLDEASIIKFVEEKHLRYNCIYFISNGIDHKVNHLINYFNLSTLTYEDLPQHAEMLVIEDAIKLEDIENRLCKKHKSVIYYPLKGRLQAILRYYFDHPANLFTYPYMEHFSNSIHHVINHVRQEITKEIAVPDRLEDLNIIAGKPLTNAFVFSICYRNQPRKILRCIHSICKQVGHFDYGVAIVDDASDYSTVKEAEEVLRENKIDYIIVKNEQRKFAARNLYNVVHLLVENDESYIIELDGDDYLYTDNVLSILHSAIEKGALKTRGSLVVDNGVQIKRGLFEKEKNSSDFSKPRNLSKCAGWYHLRMTQRSILRRVEIEHFLERKKGKWLIFTHDASVHSRAIELSKGRIVSIEEELYAYDLTGNNHDAIELNHDLEIDEWEYGSYLLEDEYLFQMFIPLFEEPRLKPSTRLGEGLVFAT